MSGRRWLQLGLGGLLAACVGFGALSFQRNFERQVERVETGFQGEARHNAFYAALRLLNEMGVEATSFEGIDGLDVLPPHDGTLLLTTRRLTLSDEKARELLDWVAAGGHLVLLARPVGDEEDEVPRRDRLLDALGVAAVDLEGQLISDVRTAATATEPEDSDPKEAESCRALTIVEFQPSHASVHYGDRDEPLEVRFQTAWRLVEESGEAEHGMRDDLGWLILGYPRGEGLVTVLADTSPLENDFIRDHDHAEFTWRLLGDDGGDGPVLVMTSEDMPSLLSLIWQHGWVAVASGALWLAFWAWAAVPRFGPVLPDPPRERRRMLEHLEASARFLWKRGQRAALLGAIRQEVRVRAHLRHPDWNQLDLRERSRRLAELTGLPVRTVGQLLADATAQAKDQGRHASRAQIFTRDVSHLEKMRNAL